MLFLLMLISYHEIDANTALLFCRSDRCLNFQRSLCWCCIQQCIEMDCVVLQASSFYNIATLSILI